jgi:ABC-type dipeptide/oligopeptide/nickel transport system permease component
MPILLLALLMPISVFSVSLGWLPSMGMTFATAAMDQVPEPPVVGIRSRG